MRRNSFLSLALALFGCPALGQVDGIAGAQLLMGGTMPDGRLLAALHIQLTPDWKTYWRQPGEGGGIPPQFDWSGSKNLGEVAMMWPKPMVWGDGGMTNIGYQGHMIVPIIITPQDAALPVFVALKVDLGVCKDICVPAQVSVGGTVADALADMAQPPTLPAPEITAAMADMPILAAQIAGASWRCTAMPIKDGMQVTAHITLPNLEGGETVVIEHHSAKIWASGAEVQRSGAVLTAVVDLVPPEAAPFDLQGADLRLTVLTQGQAIDFPDCPLE